MSEDRCDLRRDWSYLLVAGLSLLVLVTGLLLRFDPRLPDAAGVHLERSLIPLRYLDVAGLVLLLLVIYAGMQRSRVFRLRRRLSVRRSREESISLELAELSAIFEVSSRVNSFRDVEEALRFIARSARECLMADRASVFLLEGRELEMRASAGMKTAVLEGVRIALGEGVAGWAAQRRQPLLLNTRADLEAFFPEGTPDREISSALCVPLLLGGEILGVLNVTRLDTGPSAAGPFEERHLKLLGIFADYAASTIHNLRMYREVADSHEMLAKSYQELRQVQEQLIQAEKLSAVGQLISEVSHELNNPLTTVVGYSQLLARVSDDPDVQEYLEAIRSEGLRCQKIIRNLLDFARKNQGTRSSVDLNEIVRKTVGLRRNQLGIEGIEVDLDLDRSLPRAVADATSIQQVLLNLLNNGQQAIAEHRGRGRILFRTRHVRDRGVIEVRVADDGPGVAAGMRERIFEPFFTTKEKGKGTGLGLPVCRGIVENLGGAIRVDESEWGGAEFVLELPVGGGLQVLPCAVGTEEGGDPGVRGKRILVVDDDGKVLRLLEKMLRLDEHEVREASSAEEALRILEKESFDLILTDILMPEATGIDLYRRARRDDSDIASRFIFFTGGALAAEERSFFEESGRLCIRKPFEISQIRRAISGVLHGAGAA